MSPFKRWIKQIFGARKLPCSRRKRTRLQLEVLEDRTTPATITVTTAADTNSGTGAVSLRDAITAIDQGSAAGYANISGQSPGTFGVNDTINFNIPGSGVQTISVTSALPQITRSMTINGYSQTGASANTLTTGDNAVLLIDLNGNGISNIDGLDISGGHTTIEGLAINGFTNSGINIFVNGSNVITGNFIGTNAAGTSAVANQADGININTGSTNNTIGGTTPAARNLISGNGNAGLGIFSSGTSNNTIEGNYIGTNAAGTAAIANGTNGGWDGVDVSGGATSNTIGGTTAGAGNLISGNARYGVAIYGSGTSNNTLEGNNIGTNVAGTAALANGGAGVLVNGGATNDIIGGVTAGAGNTIAYNAGDGVIVSGNSTNGITVRGNAIFANSTAVSNTGGGNQGWPSPTAPITRKSLPSSPRPRWAPQPRSAAR